ncbi:MAG: GNAT family N-acetyltransferase [Elusimicrobiota bacterium]
MVDAPELETPRLFLRPMTLGDAQRLFEIYSEPETIRYWNGPDGSRHDSEQRIARMQTHWNTHGYGDWALIDKKTGAMIGFCGLHHIQGMDEINLGFLLARSFCGKGLATEASTASLRFGFGKTEMDLVVGTTAPDNAGAIKVLKKCGMSYWKEIIRNGPRSVFRISRENWSRFE